MWYVNLWNLQTCITWSWRKLEINRKRNSRSSLNQGSQEKLQSMINSNHREYRGDLKSGLVWILNGPKEAGLQIILISNGIWNFVKNHPKSGWKCLALEWSGFQMVGTIVIVIAIEHQAIWNLTFKKSGFQIPTIFSMIQTQNLTYDQQYLGYSGDLDTGLIWYSDHQHVSDCWMVHYLSHDQSTRQKLC